MAEGSLMPLARVHKKEKKHIVFVVIVLKH